MNNSLKTINYYSEELIRQSELDYQLELHGKPGFKYMIGCDFGLITTNITITKIAPEGIKIVRNMTIQGLKISEQSLLIKQLWKDYNKSATIVMNLDKLGYVIADSLSLSDVDPRDGEVLPSFVDIDDDETTDAIRVINFISFMFRSDILIRAIKLKKALEDGILHFPKCDCHFIDCNTDEILQLKQEICDIKVKLDDNGMALNFKRDNKNQINQVNRFTSALLAIDESLNYYNKKKIVNY